MKTGLMPSSVVVTGTTFFGWLMELVSSGFAESVITVAFDLSEVTPLISMGSDCGRRLRIHQLDEDFAGLAVARGAALDGGFRGSDRQDFIADIPAEHLKA